MKTSIEDIRPAITDDSFVQLVREPSDTLYKLLYGCLLGYYDLGDVRGNLRDNTAKLKS